MIKAGDIVHNKFTNMIGVVAYVDASLNQARCEHEARTAAYSLSDLVPYAGKCVPGEEYDAAKDGAKAVDATADHEAVKESDDATASA